MYIKIYFGDKPVFLCDDLNDMLHEFLHHPDTMFIDEISTPAINSLLHEITKPDFHAGILFSEDLDKLKAAFWKHFTIIQAGGGAIENEQNELLLIFRRGKWDLPKGKLDEGETIEQCALREVREETGLSQVELNGFLLTTYHTYNDYGHHVLKESYWYKMKATTGERLVPQTEEDIQEIKWVKRVDFPNYLNNTFPSVKDVLVLV